MNALGLLLALPLLAGFYDERDIARDAMASLGAPVEIVAPGAGQGERVHVAGPVTGLSRLEDPIFGVSVTAALALRRKVEIYTPSAAGDGRGYWRTQPFVPASKDFATLNSLILSGPGLAIAGWRIDPSVAAGMAFSRPAPVAGIAPPEGWRAIDGHRFYRGGDPANPAFGDLRVSFSQVPAGEYSLITQARGGNLVAPLGADMKPLLLQAGGRHEAAEMLGSARRSYLSRNWPKRIIFTALIACGIAVLILKRLMPARLIALVGARPWPMVASAAGLYGYATAAAWVPHDLVFASVLALLSTLPIILPLIWLRRRAAAATADVQSPVRRF